MNKKNFIIWITRQCNLKCTYCYENDKQNLRMNDEIIESTQKFITNYIQKNNVKRCDIHFHGGEPLLEFPVIKKFVKYFNTIEACEIDYSITTNGTLLTPEICDFLMKYFTTVSISIDGEKETHDSQRITINGNGTYDTIMKLISNFDNKEQLRVRMTVNSKNVKDLSKNVIHLYECGFTRLDPAIDFFDTWTDETVDMLLDNILKIREYHGKNNIENSFEMVSTEFYYMKGCAGGKDNISIDVDGKIYPCTFSVGNKELCIGSIKQGISESALNKMKMCYCKGLDECQGCTVENYCIATNCRILQYVATGDWNKALEILCKIQHIKLQIWKMERITDKS